MNRSFAGLRVRVVAFAVDYIAIALYLLLVVIGGIAVRTGFPALSQMVFGSPVAGQTAGFLLITLPVTLYFALLESSPWQATLGKRRQHLKVVDMTGDPLTRSRAFARTLLKFVPWELAHTCIWQIRFAPPAPSPLITAGFALVWILVGANLVSLLRSRSHQTLYDRLAGTYVVLA
ncbi:MAG: RDD family protein [Caldilineaceae bacterium]